jgi:hypothetical protein
LVPAGGWLYLMQENHTQKQPYDRQLSESEQAYAAFTLYRDLPANNRSVERAFEMHCHSNGKEYKGKSHGTWRRWCQIHDWVERARAFDAEAQRQAREEAQNERRGEYKRYIDEQYTLSKALQAYVRREVKAELDAPGTFETHQMRQLAMIHDIAGNWVRDIIGHDEKAAEL